jgi:hypothetical protein
MIVRHSAAAISGLIVWWLVIENLMAAFLPATALRFMPFAAGIELLPIDVQLTTPETIAAELSRVRTLWSSAATQPGPRRRHRPALPQRHRITTRTGARQRRHEFAHPPLGQGANDDDHQPIRRPIPRNTHRTYRTTARAQPSGGM